MRRTVVLLLVGQIGEGLDTSIFTKIANDNQCSKALDVAGQQYWKDRSLEFIRYRDFQRQGLQTTDPTTGVTYNLVTEAPEAAQAFRDYLTNKSITAAYGYLYRMQEDRQDVVDFEAADNVLHDAHVCEYLLPSQQHWEDLFQ